MNGKKEYLASSIVFAMSTVILIIHIFTNYYSKEIFSVLFILKGCCAVLFSVAAIVYFIRYRQSNCSKDDR